MTDTLPADVVCVSIPEVWADRARLSAFDAEPPPRNEKRARDRLAGRVAARWAAQRATGLPLDGLEIRTEAGGRPVAVAGGKQIGVVSISHAGRIAAAVFSRAPIGLDLETVEARDEAFETVAFTEAERLAWHGLSGDFRAREVTRAWCVKEALSKYRGTGLRVSFEDLVLTPDRDCLTGFFRDGETLYCWARVS